MVTDDVKEEFNIFQVDFSCGHGCGNFVLDFMTNCGTVVLVLLYTENNDTAKSDLLIYFKSTISERAGNRKSPPFQENCIREWI